MTKEGNGVTMCHKLGEQERGNSEVEMNKQDPAGKVLTSVIVTSVNQEDSFFFIFCLVYISADISASLSERPRRLCADPVIN